MGCMTYGSARSRRRGKAMLPREDDESQTLGHLIIQKHFLMLGEFDTHESEEKSTKHMRDSTLFFVYLCTPR